MCLVASQFLVLTLLISLCDTSSERQYECGPHGRFEYCINGFPGCVIGCHCHPGYYFDTDSKICEPNVKLTQDFRRHYHLDHPTAFSTPVHTPATTKATPTPTPSTIFDKKVDEIAKDTDELGDWLYNQFFKTIESQVINKTNENPNNALTRRSGSGLPDIKTKKSKRKSRKSLKDGKKKKGKVRGLRRKLLRITEDDSLFDSDSGSDSDSDSSSASSESDSTGTSSECDSKKDDRDHGHKKIVIFNKKPKSPLPSFIFLPNLDTPYYPPIGLPPPPIMPMYPMIPLPPIAPPMFPFPAQPNADASKPSTTTASITTVATSTEAPAAPPVIIDTVTENAVEDQDTKPPSDTPGDKPGGRSRNGMRRGKKVHKGKNHPMTQDVEHRRIEGSRNRFMHKLREKMERQKALNHLMEQEQYEESPFIADLPSSQEALAYAKKMQMDTMEAGFPKMKDVNFKYLSELIHRANLNDTNKVQPHLAEPKQHINEMLNPGENNRRSYIHENVTSFIPRATNFNPPRQLQNSASDNSFYTHLGRQIASLIRNIDSKGERQVNIEIERTNPAPMMHTILNQNSYAPRSYWERSVRSPLHYFKEKFEYLNPSNERLLSLESEVENVATTPVPLSLLELENIFNKMSKSQLAQLKSKVEFHNRESSSSASLNIDLLPKSDIDDDNVISFEITPKSKKIHETTTMYTKPIKANVTKNIEVINHTETRRNYQNPRPRVPSDLWLLDLANPSIDPIINKSMPNKSPSYNIKPTRKSFIKEVSTRAPEIFPKGHRVEYLTFLQSVPGRPLLPRTTTKTPNLKYRSQVHYKSLSYFPSANNAFSDGQALLTFPHSITTYSRGINNPIQTIQRPSYFHHELHHFDYFD